jgi:hypothetical protein
MVCIVFGEARCIHLGRTQLKEFGRYFRFRSGLVTRVTRHLRERDNVLYRLCAEWKERGSRKTKEKAWTVSVDAVLSPGKRGRSWKERRVFVHNKLVQGPG